MKNKNAFTLTELLVALGIIGAIAALSVPSLLNSINNKMLTTQLKSTVGSVQQLIHDKFITQKTHRLSETDFAAVATILSDVNFDIIKSCPAANAAKECWKTADDATNKVEYRKLSDKAIITPAATALDTIALKNGALVAYALETQADDSYATGDKVIGTFYVDVNGNDSPNIVGRDYFQFYVTDKGKIVEIAAQPAEGEETLDAAGLVDSCKDGVPSNCFASIMTNGWEMTY